MSPTASARATANRSPGAIAAGLIVVTVAIIGSFVHQSASSSSAPSLGPPVLDPAGSTAGPDGAITTADGVLPDGATVFDGGYPGIANLDPDLLRILLVAASDAAGDGIELSVNSGWRSPEYQNQLLREAVSEHGSPEEAARWVATAETSAHVAGNAVDVRPDDTAAWLSEHGAAYGLCQIYGNEPWHYELRPEANDRGCPPMYDDPTHDPRMQR